MKPFTRKLTQTALLTSGLFLLSACGNSTGDGIGAIDMAAYLPTHTMSKEYLTTGSEAPDALKEYTIRVGEIDGNRVISTFDATGILLLSQTKITDINITTTNYIPLLASETSDRYLDIDDLAFKVIFTPCYVDSLIETFTKGGHTYTGDIMKIRCEHTTADVSYTYLMKDIGMIAEIDDDCMSTDGTHVESSHIDTCPADRIRYRYRFLNR